MANELSTSQPHKIILREEEIFDVSLATFYVFDKESAGAPWPPRPSRGGPCCIVSAGAPPPPRNSRGGPCGSSIG